jgi:sulfite reductase alpha subunit-like flavoprotein
MRKKIFLYKKGSLNFGYVYSKSVLNESSFGGQKNLVRILNNRSWGEYAPGDYIGVYAENSHSNYQLQLISFYICNDLRKIDFYFMKDLMLKHKTFDYSIKHITLRVREGIAIPFNFLESIINIKLYNWLLKLLLKSANHLKPRLYSISSNKKISKNFTNITLAVVKYIKNYLNIGVCSLFLSVMPYKYISSYSIFFKVNSQFKINKSNNIRRVFICTGAGLAPIVSFLIELCLMKKKSNWLLFGERSRPQDILHSNYIKYFLYKKAVSSLDLVFSRIDFFMKHKYIFNLLLWKKNKLKLWFFKKINIYICGSFHNLFRSFELYTIKLIKTLGNTNKQAAYLLTRMGLFKYYRKDVY